MINTKDRTVARVISAVVSSGVNIDTTGFSTYTGSGNCIINGWMQGAVIGGDNSKLASISSSSVMAQPSSTNRNDTFIQAGTGSSNLNLGKNWFWVQTTYLGSPVVSLGYGPFGYLDNQKMLCSSGGNYYYLWQGSPNSWFKSLDGGATFQMTSPICGIGLPSVGFSGNIIVVPGQPGNFFCGQGVNFGFEFPFPNGGVGRSTDDGVTWTFTSNFFYGYQVAVGAPKPGGGGYPAVYLSGILNHGEQLLHLSLRR